MALVTLALAALDQALGAFSHHAPLSLLLHILLFFTQGEGIGDPEQQDTRGDHPQTFAGVIDGGRGRGGDRGRNGADFRAGLGRDDVAQRGEAVDQGLIEGAGFGAIVGDLRV